MLSVRYKYIVTDIYMYDWGIIKGLGNFSSEAALQLGFYMYITNTFKLKEVKQIYYLKQIFTYTNKYRIRGYYEFCRQFRLLLQSPFISHYVVPVRKDGME